MDKNLKTAISFQKKIKPKSNYRLFEKLIKVDNDNIICTNGHVLMIIKNTNNLNSGYYDISGELSDVTDDNYKENDVLQGSYPDAYSVLELYHNNYIFDEYIAKEVDDIREFLVKGLDCKHDTVVFSNNSFTYKLGVGVDEKYNISKNLFTDMGDMDIFVISDLFDFKVYGIKNGFSYNIKYLIDIIDVVKKEKGDISLKFYTTIDLMSAFCSISVGDIEIILINTYINNDGEKLKKIYRETFSM